MAGKVGRPRICSSPDQLYEWFEEYKAWCKANPVRSQQFVGKDGKKVDREIDRPYTLDGFEVFCFKNHGCVDRYMNGDFEDFVTISKKIKSEVREQQVSGGMAGVYNASLTARLNNLVERTDVTSKDEKVESSGTVIDWTKLDTDTLKKIVEASKKNDQEK